MFQDKNIGNVSRPVTSNQQGVHPRLQEVVRKHTERPWQGQVAEPTRRALQAFQLRWQATQRPLILDVGCGTGQSTRTLAARYPQAFVLGVDKSVARLTKHVTDHAGSMQNYQLLRANMVDVWQFAFEHAWRVARQCIYYPNPWPKQKHLQRRWYAHAIWPRVLAVGGAFEVRSNWQVYIQECGQALHGVGREAIIEPLVVTTPVSLFEQKYSLSGHGLWRLQGVLL